MKSRRDILYDQFIKEASLGSCSDKVIKAISEDAGFYFERLSIAYISPNILIRILSNEHLSQIPQEVQDEFIVRAFDAHGKSAVPLCRYINPHDRIKTLIYTKLKEYKCERIFPNYNTEKILPFISNKNIDTEETEKLLIEKCKDTFIQMEAVREIEKERKIKPEDQKKIEIKNLELEKIGKEIEEINENILKIRKKEKILEEDKENVLKNLAEEERRCMYKNNFREVYTEMTKIYEDDLKMKNFLNNV